MTDYLVKFKFADESIIGVQCQSYNTDACSKLTSNWHRLYKEIKNKPNNENKQDVYVLIENASKEFVELITYNSTNFIPFKVDQFNLKSIANFVKTSLIKEYQGLFPDLFNILMDLTFVTNSKCVNINYINVLVDISDNITTKEHLELFTRQYEKHINKISYLIMLGRLRTKLENLNLFGLLIQKILLNNSNAIITVLNYVFDIPSVITEKIESFYEMEKIIKKT